MRVLALCFFVLDLVSDWTLVLLFFRDLKLIKLVGRGTYGSVFEAKWNDTPVAVKIMNVMDSQMHSREESR